MYGAPMQKDEMGKKDAELSLEEQKLELIRLRIENGYYDSDRVLENVVSEIYKREVKN